MKWVGQHIWNLIARFRSDVYLEDINTGTIVSGGNLGLDSNNKIVKSTITTSSGDITGVDLTGGEGISVDDELNTTSGNYSATINISAASASYLGGVKIFSQAAATEDIQTASTTSNRNYVIQKIGSGDNQHKLIVNVPWINTQLTNSQVRTAVEEADDSNVFTNADHTKLNGIETGATADQTASEIRTLLGTGNGNLLPAAGSEGQFLKHDGTFGTPNYTTNTDTQLSNEQVQDIVGAMFTGNTETNITATYQDSDGTIDLVAASSTVTESFIIACSDETSNLTTGTKVTFRMPYDFTITSVRASLTTAASSSEDGQTTDIEITKEGSSIFSGDVKLNIDTEETTSVTAASPPSINSDIAGCSADDEIKITINNVLSTPGAGLKVTIIGNQ